MPAALQRASNNPNVAGKFLLHASWKLPRDEVPNYQKLLDNCFHCRGLAQCPSALAEVGLRLVIVCRSWSEFYTGTGKCRKIWAEFGRQNTAEIAPDLTTSVSSRSSVGASLDLIRGASGTH